jgi:hypothetical protein
MIKNLANTIMVPDNTIRNVDADGDGMVDGFLFDFRNPFYTAEPISGIEGFLLKIDGESFDPEKIVLKVRGQEIMASRAKTVYEIWMTIGEVIPIYVEKSGGLIPGKHKMELTLRLRTTIPYGLGTRMYRSYPAEKIMTVL